MDCHHPSITAPSPKLVIHSMKDVHAVPACPKSHEPCRTPNDFGIGKLVQRSGIGTRKGMWSIQIIPMLGRYCDQGLDKSFHVGPDAGPCSHERADVQCKSHGLTSLSPMMSR